MALTSGDKLGPYEILAPIGAGGMGEVYRARDPRLNRDVAIKTSAAQFSERFEREAKAIAALNHPNICHLYDVGPNYLVMEYIEGETPQGPLPLEEVLRIGKQICAALEAAHEKGITHRDLKPANIKIKPDGTVKVLDFGLAKVDAVSGVSQSENSPTLSMAATQMGVILGTAGYMSPEQARGKSVDKRADIWAFGVVFYELLMGKRLFQGEDVSHTMAAVIMQEPNLDEVPVQVRKLLRRCLEKDPKKRLRDISGVELLLESGAEVPRPENTSAGSAPNRIFPWVAAGVLAAGLAALAFLHFREQAPETPLVKFSIAPPEGTAFTLTGTGRAPAVISPDGKRLVFGATSADGKSQLWVRSLDTLAAQPLANTDGASYPFWSADSRSIGFFADGKLKKIDASGGAAFALCAAPQGRGGTWSQDGVIVFAPDGNAPLHQVSEAGGASSSVTSLDKATSDRWPWFLPDGRHFLYVEQGAAQNTGTSAAIRVASLDGNGRDSKTVLTNEFNAIYSQGYLLFLREGTLMAQAFDLKLLATTAAATPVAEKVEDITLRRGVYSVSKNGLLVYRTGSTVGGAQLAWLGRDGKPIGKLGDPASLNAIHLSWDRKSASVAITDRVRGDQDIWLYDVLRPEIKTRFSFDPAEERESAWSPDGRTVIFNSNRKGHFDLYRKASNSVGAEELLYADEIDKYPTSFSPDGKFLLYYTNDNPKTKTDLMVLPLAGDKPGKPFPFLQTPFNEGMGQFSPNDGRIAYTSDESQRSEIYVAPFPGPGGKKQISTVGGRNPIWRPDGKELFYIAPDNMLMAAEVSVKGPVIDVGAVRPLFGPIPRVNGNLFDVSADGKSFLVRTVPAQTSSGEPLTVVQNWTTALKK